MSRVAWILLLAALPAVRAEEEASPSAFRFDRDPRVKKSIRLGELIRGVKTEDPRDGIPTIREPKHVAAGKARWIAPEARVLGLEVNGESRAYPLNVLEGHELVNDTLGGVPVAPNY